MTGVVTGVRAALEADGWTWTHGRGRMLCMTCPEGAGVQLALTADGVDLMVDRLRAIHPGRGDGTRAMSRFLAVADALGLDVTLRAVPPGGRRGGRLRSWYGTFGFRAAGYGPADMMVRSARLQAESAASASEVRKDASRLPSTPPKISRAAT